MIKKIWITVLSCLTLLFALLGVACGDNGGTPLIGGPAQTPYDESKYAGTGIVGVPSLLDMVGYDASPLLCPQCHGTAECHDRSERPAPAVHHGREHHLPA